MNDEVLLQAFGSYGTVSEARVMWDMKTGRSRGYGFVAFRDRMEADRALTGMNGEFLGSRAIRCNWANQKGQPSVAQQQVMTQMGMNPVPQAFPAQQQPQQQPQQQVYPQANAPSFAAVLQQTPQHMTTVYVGNLSPYTNQSELLPLFQQYGYVQEVRLQTDRGYAFVKMDSHEGAAQAIVALNNYNINGKPLKLGVSASHWMSASLYTLLTICSGARTRMHLAIPNTRHSHLRILSQVSLSLLATSLSTVNKPCLLRVRFS